MNERLTIQNLVDLLASKHGMTKKDAEAFVKEFFLLIEETLESEKYLKIKGLGTFKLIEVENRESVKVNTGERFQIRGHSKVSFSPDTNLRDIINKPFAHFETVVLNENTVLDGTSIEEETEDDMVSSDESMLEEKVVIEQDAIKENSIEEPAAITEDVVAQPIEIRQGEPIVPEEVAEEVVEERSPPIAEQHSIKLAKDEVKYTAEQIITQELQKIHSKLEGSLVQSERSNLSTVSSDVLKKEKSAIPYLITIIVIVLLLCASAILFIYYPDVFSSSSNDKLDMPVAKPVRPNIELSDTIENKDAIAEIKPETSKKVVVQSKPVIPPVYLDSATYIIEGTKATHTIRSGETLTKISLQYYGTKTLWSYIVKHNAGVIKNADNVPYGTVIKIPELTKN